IMQDPNPQPPYPSQQPSLSQAPHAGSSAGQGPIDPRGAFGPPPPAPGEAARPYPGHMGSGGGMPPPMPPPGYPPMPPVGPMMMPPMWGGGPPRKERSFAGAIFTTLATTILGLSIALNVYLLIALGLSKSAESLEKVLLVGDESQKVVVLPITGEIGDATAVR